MSISVIIPCYNSHKYLKRSIESVLNQNFSNFEIVLINDGSDSLKTLNILDQYRDNLKIKIIDTSNNGLPFARNTGVKNSKYNNIFFLDSDDYIHPDTLNLLNSKVDKLDDNFFFFWISLVGDKKGILKKNYNFFEQHFLNQIPYSIFISKKNFYAVKGYDATFYNGYEDWDLNLRLGINKIKAVLLPYEYFFYNYSTRGMLFSKSNKIYGYLFNKIRKKNKKEYNILTLISKYNYWKKYPSNINLNFYLIWFLILSILPSKITSIIFILLFSKFSKSSKF